MIDKIGMSPAFTSKVNILYNNDFSLRDFYNSNELRQQVKALEHNGVNDTVTLIPKPAKSEIPPCIQLQIISPKKMMYNNKYYIYAPDQLLDVYEKATKDEYRNVYENTVREFLA